MEKKYLKLDDVKAYKIAFHLSNYVWDIVMQWDYFAKNTLEQQFADAVDSISANIAEGSGRYGKKDKIRFYRISFGSLKESFDWNEKAKVRRLLTKEQYTHIFGGLEKLPTEINSLIKYTNSKLQY